ncbi:hypothetical protein [Dyella nitratireducens]|uniref:Trypsin-like peptidase domain-containing protein n=1 Tax=Dyella nitratireducens TaxID=1849580 RepID=A0ABQ1GE85_9GAMM|nr:hypothetical protein [Dyella nitratireducens]GGA41832.1 hypothetical protein GCM10010981_33550 [Dyella nitratireducens]GLQ42089.1 hypothetical protein GCM10007902_19390 [Dyella nitratireducens]
MATLAEALEVKLRVERRLLALQGVHTVGLGGKVTAGLPTGEVAIRVQVTQKKPLSEIPAEERIPETIDGIKTDVIQSARAVKYSTLSGGVEIEFIDSSTAGTITMDSGTLGCFARTTGATPQVVLLSNDHVLYGETPRRKDGDPVLVESSTGCVQKTVAFNFKTAGNNDPLVDAAIATLASGTDWQAQIHGVAVKGILDFRQSNLSHLPTSVQNQITNHTYHVNKYGATTSLKGGVIIDINATTDTMSGQLQIKPDSGNDYFSKPGDSGSAIYDDNGYVIGLLWGGDPILPKSDPHYIPPPWNSVGSHIGDVQDKLSITIATNEPAVVYHVGGKPQLHPAFARVYTDLSAVGRQKEFVRLYGHHSEEFRRLLKDSRPFLVAWHRNHGPKIVRSLFDLANDRLGTLPTSFEGQTWTDCLERIEQVLIRVGSDELRVNMRKYRDMALRLGGRTYQEVLGFLLTAGIDTSHSSPHEEHTS